MYVHTEHVLQITISWNRWCIYYLPLS